MSLRTGFSPLTRGGIFAYFQWGEFYRFPVYYENSSYTDARGPVYRFFPKRILCACVGVDLDFKTIS